MLKKEIINFNDPSLTKFEGKTNIYKMSDGRILKKVRDEMLFFYDLANVDLKDKLEASLVLEGLNAALPISVIYDNGVCVGYTMEELKGKSLNEVNDSLEFIEKFNINRYIELYRKINDLVKKYNERGVVMPDLLTCDNIIIDDTNNVSFIDIDDMQILDYPTCIICNTLGSEEEITTSKKFMRVKRLLFSKELDKKSLTHLFFVDALNIDLYKAMIFKDSLEKTLNDYGLDDIKILRNVKDNIYDFSTGTYLDKMLNIIDKNYRLSYEYIPANEKLVKIYGGLKDENGVYRKKLVRK